MKKKILILGSVGLVFIIVGIILAVKLLKPTDQPPVVIDPTEELSIPRGITLTGTVLSWDKVENATEYGVYVNDKEYLTNECSIDLNGKANERDKIKVVAKANGYFDSKYSIEKIYITIINKEEITSMSTNVATYMSEIGYDDTTIEQVGKAIENVCVALFKEGLVSSDVENILTTVDDIVNTLETTVVNTPSELVKVVTDELNKLVDLNINGYTITVAVKEISLFIVDTFLNEISLYKENLNVIYPNQLVNGLSEEDIYELLANLKEYLENISSRDLEKIAFVFDTYKNIYVALEKDLPLIISEIEKLETTIEGEISYEALYSVIENLVKIKDSTIAAILSQMPSMEDFTEVISLFESLYDNLAPDYLVESNPYDLIVALCQEAYSGVHKILSFVKELDAELLTKIKPHLTNIYDILEKDYNEIMNLLYSNDILSSIEKLLAKTGLTEDEIKDLVFGVMMLVEDITETPEEFAIETLELITTEISNAFSGIDFSVITNEPLVQTFISILYSENPVDELNKFLKEDLKIEKYISYKEGKTSEDLLNALKNVSIKELFIYIASQEDGLTLNELITELGLNDIVFVNIQGLLLEFTKFLNVETLNLITDIAGIDEIADIEKILSKYFKVEVIFSDIANNIFEKFLEKYYLNIDYKMVVENLIKEFGFDKIYAELENIYKILETTTNEFNVNYVPLVSTEKYPTNEELVQYTSKYALYYVFGNDGDAALKDMTNIYELILSLKEHNEIVDIFNNVVNLFENFDYSFDFDSYINDEEYLTAFNKKLIDLANSLLDEVDNTFNWVLGFEQDLDNVAAAIDEFTLKYFGISFYTNEYVKYIFEMLSMYEITDDMEEIYKSTISDFVENILKEILFDIYNLSENVEELYNNLYLAVEENVEQIVHFISEFEKVIDVNEYLNNEEYRNEFNQKLISLMNNLIDKYVSLYDDVILTEEKFSEFALYVDELCVKYFDDNMDLEYLVIELFDNIKQNKLTEEEIISIKAYVETIINDYLTTIILEVYNVKDELYEFSNEIITDIFTNVDEIYELVIDLLQTYVIYYNEASEIAKPGVLDEYIDYEKMQKKYAIQKLYVEKDDEINELCDLLETIFTIENEEILSTLDDAIENICTLFGVESEVNATSLMNDLIVIVELVKNFDEMIFDNPSILDKIPSIEIDDVIIPV